MREKGIADAITKCVERHREPLLRKREQGVFLDEYGKLEDSAWRKEVVRFTRRVVLDEVSEACAFSEESIVEFTLKTIEKTLGPALPQSRQCGF